MNENKSRGVGGAYVIDPLTGERKQVEATKPAAPKEDKAAAEAKPTRRNKE